MKSIRSVAVLFVLFTIAASASAQTPFGSPDNRYKGYPASLVAWPDKPLNNSEIAACAASKPYEPRDTHLTKYVSRLKVANVRVQETDECAFMRVAGGDRWVLRVKGTKVGQDEMNRDLVDLGSPTGLVCDNTRPFSVPVNVPRAPAPAPRITTAEPPVDAPAPPVRVRREPRVVLQPAPTPAPTPEPAYTPPPPPAKPVHTRTEPSGVVVTVGAGYVFGSVNTDYTYPNPSKGDVPQKNPFSSPVLTVRVDQAQNHGVFAEATATLLEKSGEKLYQDITGAWNPKKRDTDTTRDTSLGLKAGYKFALGDIMSVGASINYDRFCMCEKYHAQNTDTETQRSFQTFGLGVEAAGSTNSEEHRLTVRVSGTLGLSGNRDKFTTQVYQGPPVITFPKVTDPQQSAKLNRLGAEADMQVAGHVHVFGLIQRSSWESTRPDAHPATEHTSSLGTTIGIRWKF